MALTGQNPSAPESLVNRHPRHEGVQADMLEALFQQNSAKRKRMDNMFFLLSQEIWRISMKKPILSNNFLAVLLAIVTISFVFIGCDSAIGTENYGTGSEAVNLGTAGDYVILAKSGVSSVPASVITGDVGLSPAAETYLTGFSLTDSTGYATSAQVTGFLYAADMVSPTSSNLTTAVSDMTTAYNDAASRSNPDYLNHGAGEIGSLTLAPGLYKWTSSVTIGSNVTIAGSATDTWVFQISGDLTLANDFDIILSGGAMAKNIFWQVAGETTMGTGSHFEGIVLCMTQISMNTLSSINGRLLAQTRVALDRATVTNPAQ